MDFREWPDLPLAYQRQIGCAMKANRIAQVKLQKFHGMVPEDTEEEDWDE